MTVLAQYLQGRTKVQVPLWGGGFGNALGSLRSRSYMTGSDGLHVTDAELAALGTWEPLPPVRRSSTRGMGTLRVWFFYIGSQTR